MERKEIIENLKKNERAFHFLSEEEQDVFKSLDKLKDVLYMCSALFYKCEKIHHWELNVVYRIRLDYVEEENKPKYLELPIKHGHTHQNMFVAWKGMSLGLHKCCNYPAFIGFKFKDEISLHVCATQYNYNNISKEYERLIPTHAVFINN